MFKKLNIFVLFFILCIPFGASAQEIVTETLSVDFTDAYYIADLVHTENNTFIPPQTSQMKWENEYVSIEQSMDIFKNGDFFWLRRYYFNKTTETNCTSSFLIAGSEIDIRYMVMQTDSKTFVSTKDYQNLPKGMLFIQTDKESLIMVSPMVYEKDTPHGAMVSEPKVEWPISIEKGEDHYNIMMRMPQNVNYFAEVWALQSKNVLVNWEKDEGYWLGHEFFTTQRFSREGYYFKMSQYIPLNPNAFFKHPANYSPLSFARVNNGDATLELGYSMLRPALKNQNAYGFWPTEGMSVWLDNDFQIGRDFYDTRFNTDFAKGLLKAYKTYNDKEMLTAALKYAEFYLSFAKQCGRILPMEESALLVPDYWHASPHVKTHTSLNHQLAEMNLLYELYLATREMKYLHFADRLKNGIAYTKDSWVLGDNNLAYAILYEGNRQLVDYPYLTYNDLREAQRLITLIYGTEDETIQYLMDCKKKWMDFNGVEI